MQVAHVITLHANSVLTYFFRAGARRADGGGLGIHSAHQRGCRAHLQGLQGAAVVPLAPSARGAALLSKCTTLVAMSKSAAPFHKS